VKVTDPAGSTWRISRRWVPWRRRLKATLDSVPDLPSLGDDPISLVIGLVLLIVMIPVLLLALAAGLELLLLMLVLPFALLARVAFGRHWHVEVRNGFTYAYEVDAGGWRASAAAIREIADEVRQGRHPDPRTGDS
jgi:hypothetical protein